MCSTLFRPIFSTIRSVATSCKGSEGFAKQDARIPFEVKGSGADIVSSTSIWKADIISTSCTCSTRMSRKS